MKTHLHSNQAISELLNDLEEMQHNLLMIKASALAFDGKFNEDCPYDSAKSPYSEKETAEYFVCQFLELDPDAKLDQAIRLIYELGNQFKDLPKRTNRNQTKKGSIQISIDSVDFE